MNRSANAICVLLLAVFASSCALAQAPPSDDAYTISSQPLANFGRSGILPVQSGTVSYIRLNLGVFPAGENVSKATLKLYVNAVLAPGAFDVYPVRGSWNEARLSYTNAPSLGVSATNGRTVAVSAFSLNKFLLIDVTNLVRGWLNGSIPNNGIALALKGVSGSFSFDSKESTGTGHQPEIDVTFTTIPESGGSAALSESAVAGTGADSSESSTVSAQQIGSKSAQGHGTKGYLPLWLNALYLGNSNLFQDVNKNIGVGTLTPLASLDVSGSINASKDYQIGGNPVLVVTPLHNNSGGNVFLGLGVGSSNTTGIENTAGGLSALGANLTGGFNTAYGASALASTTTGAGNTAIGARAGQNNVTGSQDVYIANQGPQTGSESGAIRIGDPANQTTAYIAGISGASTSSGVPVFVDSTGKLGTGGGSVSFTQVTGTVSSQQLTGTYANALTLSNTSNQIAGNFTGNGAGLTGVASGLNWPVVPLTGDYAVQLTDFATPTTRGNFLVLRGALSHTFTLPNPPPPNGSCVAIGNVADAGINSGTNVFLTVSPNGVNMDTFTTGNSVTPTMPRRTSYLYCSDGSNYFRLGYSQNGVSEIGPWLETLDTGTVNAYKTTFRNGMDFGLINGSMIFLLVKTANTATLPTLDVNGLGVKKILKYGNQALAPGDLSTIAYALLIYDGVEWQLLNPQTTKSTLTGTTGNIGGTSLSAGSCTSGTASVTGAVVGHPVSVSAADGSLPSGLIVLSAAVTSSNVVTVQLCAVASVTPVSNTYNVATQ